MAGINSFESSALRALHKRINAEKANRVHNLSSGTSRVTGNPTATGENYVEAIAYLLALDHVIEWCQDVEDDLMGRKTKA